MCHSSIRSSPGAQQAPGVPLAVWRRRPGRPRTMLIHLSTLAAAAAAGPPRFSAMPRDGVPRSYTVDMASRLTTPDPHRGIRRQCQGRRRVALRRHL
jgi:hypothetical protein